MLQRFYPTAYYQSAYDIDYQALYDNGCRGIIYDVDNTLVEHDAPVDKRAKQLFLQLHKMGIQTCILSNNKEERVAPLAKTVQSEYVSKAKKPSPVNYKKAMKQMHTDMSNTIFVGDQLFTDVWGGNRAGVMTVLVAPIAKHEEIQIVLKRYLERIVMHFYWKKLRKGAVKRPNNRLMQILCQKAVKK